jgi:hypothetical protein
MSGCLQFNNTSRSLDLTKKHMRPSYAWDFQEASSYDEARSAPGWGTVLQGRRSLEFFIDIILLATIW